jgi:hypothetical protein
MIGEANEVCDPRALDDCWITAEQLLAAISDDVCIGFCVACGAEQYGVEPDAREYLCQECGSRKVYGAEDLLIRMI